MPKKKKKANDACAKKVKARYKVWPSAYASGAVAKSRKSPASGAPTPIARSANRDTYLSQ